MGMVYYKINDGKLWNESLHEAYTGLPKKERHYQQIFKAAMKIYVVSGGTLSKSKVPINVDYFLAHYEGQLSKLGSDLSSEIGKYKYGQKFLHVVKEAGNVFSTLNNIQRPSINQVIHYLGNLQGISIPEEGLALPEEIAATEAVAAPLEAAALETTIAELAISEIVLAPVELELGLDAAVLIAV